MYVLCWQTSSCSGATTKFEWDLMVVNDLTWLSQNKLCIIICLWMKLNLDVLEVDHFQFPRLQCIFQREIKIWGADKEDLWGKWKGQRKNKVYDNQRIICAVWSYWKPNCCYCIPSISLNVILCERGAAFWVELLNGPETRCQWNETPCN